MTIGIAVVRRFRCSGDEVILRGMFRTRLRLAHADAYGRKGCIASVNVRWAMMNVFGRACRFALDTELMTLRGSSCGRQHRVK